jgi:hypothetical protein
VPRGFFFFEQRDSGRASKIVTLAGPFLQAVAHALQTESEVGSEDQGLFNEDQIHGCAKLPLGDCGIRRTMDKAAEREEILQSAIAGVRRVAQAIAALPEGDQERAFAAAKRSYEQTVRDLEYSDDVARSWVSAMMHRLRADVKEVGGGDGRPDESAAS